MDFFEAQARAKKRTNRLVFLFVLAVLGTILAGYAAAMAMVTYTHADYRSPGRARYDYVATTPFSWWNPQVFTGVALGTIAVAGFPSPFNCSQTRKRPPPVPEIALP